MDQYETRFLVDVWTTFWLSPLIEPDIRNVPVGVTPSQWVAMVYRELEERKQVIPLTPEVLTQLELKIMEDSYV